MISGKGVHVIHMMYGFALLSVHCISFFLKYPMKMK